MTVEFGGINIKRNNILSGAKQRAVFQTLVSVFYRFVHRISHHGLPVVQSLTIINQRGFGTLHMITLWRLVAVSSGSVGQNSKAYTPLLVG